MANREVVRFQADQPEIVQLAYSTGRPTDGKFGDQFMWGLHGDRLMFLDPPVNDQLLQLSPKTGDKVSILKRSVAVGGRRRIEWDVQLVNDRDTRVWPRVETPAPLPPQQAAPAPAPAPRQPMMNASGQTSLELALSTVIVACAKAEKFATDQGLSIRFTSEDVRAFTNTLMINAERGR